MTAATLSAGSLPRSPASGVCLHLTSLPGTYGIGEIGQAAFDFIDRMAEAGLSVWQFLPTGPTAYGDSPYQPLSSFAGNELLIDVAGLLRAGLSTPAEAGNLRALPDHEVDYGRLIPPKVALLQRATSRFGARATSAMKAGFDAFVDANDEPWLHDYALFRTLKSRARERPWPEWPPELVHRDENALRKVERDAAREIEQIKVAQYLFDEQWRALRRYASERGVMLFGDLPIYIALDSSDAWAAPEMLLIDADGRPTGVAGVPPDYYSRDGQLWGNPLYDWDRLAADGYGWWADRLRRAVELADIVRIDHFRGFESYWAIPAGADTARSGEWLAGPGDSIFEALSAALGGLPIVAEDLGMITPGVRELRDRHDIPGMKVLQFEVVREDFSLSAIGENCVCYTGTHDNDTTLGWFRGSPNDIRSSKQIHDTRRAVLEITSGSPETIHNDLIRLAFSSDARLAIAPLQDYLGLGSEARLNVPGTSSGNWRWRLERHRLSQAVVDSIGELVAEAGRSPRR